MSAPVDSLVQLVRLEFGLTGEWTRLAGEQENYRLDTPDGQHVIVKCATAGRADDLDDLERAVVAHLRAVGIGVALPVERRAASAGPAMLDGGHDGAGRRVRVLDVVPGQMWGAARPSVDVSGLRLFRSLGALLGRLNVVLAGFHHPGAQRTHDWDLAAAARHRVHVPAIADVTRRALAEWAFQQHGSALPGLSRLPRAVIHGDANDENVFVERGVVSGLIDFGDCLWNPAVCELAIALAYAMLDLDDPLSAGANVVAGYHAERPLSADEHAVLFALVCGRLAVTVTTAARRRHIDPRHPTWFVTEEPAWRLLAQLAAIDPVDGADRLAAETDLQPLADRGASVEALVDRRRAHLSSALSIAYRQPLKMVRGRAQFLFDHRGRPFLDLVNNVCHVGHCHPRVVHAGQRQLAQLNTNTRYLHDTVVDYAERLAATFPKPLAVCFFVNSGTEANELALRLAATHTGRTGLLVVDSAYHGHTGRLVGASPYKFMGPGGAKRPGAGVYVVPAPDTYRGIHQGDTREAGVAYGDAVRDAIDHAAEPIAALLAESLPSCGGQLVPPPGYFDTAFRHVRTAGGVCIADEVQTGFGRVGASFWAFEQHGVIPDIVVLGKPMGNGHPMGAVVTTADIARSFDNGMEFFSTFGGNPVSAAIGLAVLDVIRDEGLQAHALEVGTRLKDGLRALMPRHPMIGDVRGMGLFLGVELVRDRQSRAPATDDADTLVNRLQQRGLLLSTDGPHHNVIKIKPPLVVTAEDVDAVVRIVDAELERVRPA